MDIHERLEVIYSNCLAHMSNTYEDWEKAFNALRNTVRKSGDRPEDIREALKYYGMLEEHVGRRL